MALGNLIRRFARGTMRMTEGFDRVFGPQRRASHVSRQRAGEKAAEQSRRQGRRPLFRRDRSGPDVARRDERKQEDGKLFDFDKDRRLY